MQRDGGVLGRAGAAHAAETVVADEDGRPQSPVDSAGLPAFVDPGRFLLRRGCTPRPAASAADEGGESLKRLVPGAESPLVCRRGEARQPIPLDQLIGDRLSPELAPDLGKILEQLV